MKNMIFKGKNEVANKYSKLLVISFSHSQLKYGNFWKCLCDCGKEVVIRGSSLRSGHTKSCGCILEYNKFSTHKMTNTPTYIVWFNMKQRCDNKKHKSYSYYGGRGITYDPRWSLFENFLEDMGERPESKTLDRVDNNGNYSKDNCRWETRNIQTYNQRKQLDSKSGHTGIYKYGTRWHARITFNKITVKLGVFDNIEDAVEARKRAEIKYYGFERK